MYRINKHNQGKPNILLKQDRKLFHTADLALLWGITKKNTLYTTIKRYVDKNILIPIHKGFYSTIELNKINPVILGVSFLHQYAYLSTESILVESSIIIQNIPYLTLIAGVSKRFQIGDQSYYVRQLKEQFLYQTTGIIQENGYRKATPERAVADLLYFNPYYHFDGVNLINWEKVHYLQKEVGYRK